MIDKIEDLGLEEKDELQQIDAKIKEHLGIGLDDMHQALSESVQERAVEFAQEMFNLAPMGDYDKLTDDKDVIADFLRTEAHKPEHWRLNMLDIRKDGLLHFSFLNLAVDEGDSFVGSVYVSKSGQIRHAFAHGE